MVVFFFFLVGGGGGVWGWVWSGFMLGVDGCVCLGVGGLVLVGVEVFCGCEFVLGVGEGFMRVCVGGEWGWR